MLALTTASGAVIEHFVPQSALDRHKPSQRTKAEDQASSPRHRQSPTNQDLYFFPTHTSHAGRCTCSGASRRVNTRHAGAGYTRRLGEEWILGAPARP